MIPPPKSWYGGSRSRLARIGDSFWEMSAYCSRRQYIEFLPVKPCGKIPNFSGPPFATDPTDSAVEGQFRPPGISLKPCNSWEEKKWAY